MKFGPLGWLLWPVIQLASVASNPIVKRRVEKAIKVPKGPKGWGRLLAACSWPILAARGAGTVLRFAAPDIHRSVRVWRAILPVFSSYMWTKWSTNLGVRVFKWDRDKVEARWAARHDKGGEDVFNLVNKVRGYYVKSGQLLATKREFVPEAWCRRLAHLWDNTPPRPWRNVRASILRDLDATQLGQRLKHPHKPGEAEELGVPLEADAVPDLAVPSAAGPASEGGAGSAAGSMSALSWAAPSFSWLRSSMSHAAPKSTAALSVADEFPEGGEQEQGPGKSTAVLQKQLGLFTVSRTAASVMAQRVEEREQCVPASQRKHRDRQMERWFEFVDPQPLACASIAQVHVATLSAEMMQLLGSSWQHGPEVVIKVQHSDVQRLMGADLRNMGRIARFLNHVLPFDVTPAVREMQGAIPKEFDFQRESVLMGCLRTRLSRVCKAILIPEPVLPLCGPGLIVMQRMEGTPLTALLAKAHAGDAAARDAARRCLLPVLEAYGHMILVDGLFHADPHPGNMLLQADGRVALLDFGQCKALTAVERRALCTLYASLASGDIRTAVKAVAPFGMVFGNAAKPAAGQSTAPSNPTPTPTAAGAATHPAAEAAAAGSAPAPSPPARTLSRLFSSRKTTEDPGGAGAGAGAAPTPAAGSTSLSEGGAAAPTAAPASSPAPSGGFLTRLLSSSRRSAEIDELAAAGVDPQAVAKMLHLMFDIKWVAEGAYSFSGGDVVEGAPLAAFPGSLYLVCRAILILRGLCASLQLEDLSVVALWRRHAAAGLRERQAVAEARAQENAALDRGLTVPGL